MDEDPGADPAARTPPRGEGDRYAAIAAAAAAEQTGAREGRSEAASVATGAAGKRNLNSSRPTKEK